MISLGLSARDRQVFQRALVSSHQMRLKVRILDRNERHVSELVTAQALSGAVQVDATATPTRQLQMSLLDPGRRLRFVPNLPFDAPAFADNFIAVHRGIYVKGLSGGDDWVDVPVFQGPMTHLERHGSEVDIEGLGKETLGVEPALLWEPQNFRKGAAIVTTIRQLMAAQGEARFDLPELSAGLVANLSVKRHDEPWLEAKKLAHSINRQIFYDGAGRLRMRAYPQNPLYTFHAGGSTGSLLANARVVYDVPSTRNTVEVLGPEPRGPNKRVRAVAYAPNYHPLSPWSLSRNGEPRWLVDVVELTDAKRAADAQAVADRRLDEWLTKSTQVSFDCLPITHLEEMDRVTLWDDTTGEWLDFYMGQFTIPLTSNGSMSVGALTRVSTRPRRRRR